MKQIIATFLFLVMFLNANNQAQTKSNADSERLAKLDAQIKTEAANFKGKFWIYAKNLDTGETYSFKGEERVRTASTIKTAIMVEAYAQVAEGKVKWTDELVLTKEKKVGGSGILFEFSDGLKLTFRDAVNLMMVISDNAATNLVLDVVTCDAVNSRMDLLGLKNTLSLRKVFGGGESKAWADPVLKTFGLGVTTPKEMVTLLEKIEKGEIVSKEASGDMIALMKRQQTQNGIGRSLLDVPIASKSGALDRLRSEAGIIYTRRGRIAMAITTDDMPEIIWTNDNPGYLMLSKLSLILIDGLAK